jgi:hypothetical protein
VNNFGTIERSRGRHSVFRESDDCPPQLWMAGGYFPPAPRARWSDTQASAQAPWPRDAPSVQSGNR